MKKKVMKKKERLEYVFDSCFDELEKNQFTIQTNEYDENAPEIIRTLFFKDSKRKLTETEFALFTAIIRAENEFDKLQEKIEVLKQAIVNPGATLLKLLKD